LRKTLVIVAASLALAGCNKKISQCGKLIDRIANEQRSLDAAAKGTGKGNAKEMAKAIDTARADLRAMTISDAKLAGYQGDYVRVLDALFGAMTSSASDASFDVSKPIDTAKKDEASVVDNINAYCGGS
jgi:hypothetical protein